MSMHYIGEIRMFATVAVPKGWLPCDGRLLKTTEYTPLFSIIKNRFGGDGATNFCLPNLKSRAPIGAGKGTGLTERVLGGTPGQETCTLFSNHLPIHSHRVSGTASKATHTSAADNMFAHGQAGSGLKSVNCNAYNEDIEHLERLGSASLSTCEAKESSHNNMQPYLRLCFCIAYDGIFPPRPV